MNAAPELYTHLMTTNVGKPAVVLQNTTVAVFTDMQAPHHRTLQLLTQLGIDSAQVCIAAPDTDQARYALMCDLILFECFGCSNDKIEMYLLQIRSTTHAPLAVLVNSPIAGYTIQALKAGADAVIPFTLPHNVALAQLTRLVNRWKDANSKRSNLPVSH